MLLPADWLSNSAAGVKSLLGTWQDLLADAAGIVGYYSVLDNALANCDIQGTVSLPGAGGDMTLINTNVAINQPITIASWSITEGNA